MATTNTTTQPKTRQKPSPDILRDARRVRDILATYDAEQRSALINLSLAALPAPKPEPAT